MSAPQPRFSLRGCAAGSNSAGLSGVLIGTLGVRQEVVVAAVLELVHELREAQRPPALEPAAHERELQAASVHEVPDVLGPRAVVVGAAQAVLEHDVRARAAQDL